MTGPTWVPTVDESEVRDGACVAVHPEGLRLLVARIDGDLFAVENKCVHMGCRLDTGRLEGAVITCPCHDWRFDLRTGVFLDAPELALATFPVRVEDGKVAIEVEA